MIDEHLELWRPVVDFEGYYEVSDHGRVRSVARWTSAGRGAQKMVAGRLLQDWIDPDGYHHVNLSKGGVAQRCSAHRLVCEAFHGGAANPDLEVRHLNGNPGDNQPSNLKWGTGVENAQDCLRHGTNAQRRKTHCRRGHPFDAENTLLGKNGHRRCRTCHHDRYHREHPGAKRLGPYNTSETHCKNGHLRTEINTYITKTGHKSCRVCHREYERNRQRKPILGAC